MANKTSAYYSTSPSSVVDVHSNRTACAIHQHGPQHCQPHQRYLNELMREYDPKDPANKYRTFDKMVAHANKKHLNPGEQSFHYYVDDDGEVHGFIAVGNINDKMPHIIISDTGDEASYAESISKLEDIVDNLDIESLQNEITEFRNIMLQSKHSLVWISMD